MPVLILPLSIVLLLLQDTYLPGMIDGYSRLRLVVPCGFLVLMMYKYKYVKFITPTNYQAFAIVATTTSVLAINDIIALIKLGMLIAIAWPLLTSAYLHKLYLDRKVLYSVGGVFACFVAGILVTMSTGRTLFNNPNQTGLFTLCAAPVFMMCHFLSKARWLRMTSLLALVVATALCVSTISRGSIVGLAVFFVTYFLLSGITRPRRAYLGIVTAAVVGAAVLMSWYYNTDSYSLFKEQYVYKGKGTLATSQRVATFNESWEAIMQRPLSGYGFGMSWFPEDITDQVFQTGRVSWYSVEFGNSTIALLVSGGIFLAIAYYSIILRFVQSGLRALKQSPREKPIAVLIAAVAGLMVNAQAEAWVISPLTWSNLIFFMYLGMLASYSRASYGAAVTREVASPRLMKGNDWNRKRPLSRVASSSPR